MSELSKAEIGAEKIDAASHSLKAGDLTPADVLLASARSFSALANAVELLLQPSGVAGVKQITTHIIDTIAADTNMRAVLAALGTFKASLNA